LNHWWQTETGHSITATCLGFGHNLKPPMFSAGMPFPGYDGKFLEYDQDDQLIQFMYTFGEIT